MTATLTRDFFYTDHEKVTNSTVISDLYYNSNDQSLVVVLHSGVKAGYQNVPGDVYRNFAAENTGFYGSVGAYWNSWIKTYFQGLDTSGVENFVDLNAETTEEEDVIFNGVSEAETTPDVVNDEQALWTVGFVEDGMTNELSVYAESLTDAVSKVDRIAVIAGWQNVRIVSVFEG